MTHISLFILIIETDLKSIQHSTSTNKCAQSVLNTHIKKESHVEQRKLSFKIKLIAYKPVARL